MKLPLCGATFLLLLAKQIRGAATRSVNFHINGFHESMGLHCESFITLSGLNHHQLLMVIKEQFPCLFTYSLGRHDRLKKNSCSGRTRSLCYVRITENQ